MYVCMYVKDRMWENLYGIVFASKFNHNEKKGHGYLLVAVSANILGNRKEIVTKDSQTTSYINMRQLFSPKIHMLHLHSDFSLEIWATLATNTVNTCIRKSTDKKEIVCNSYKCKIINNSA